jgi:anaerobic ribonucleoside-triphosphate reductase activating protein
MAQAQALIPFAKAIREAGLSVIVFSGYRREQMLHLPHAEELLQNIDTLVDGQYDKTQPEDTRRWIGSKNQRLFYLTDRYSDKDFMGVKDTVEIRWDGKSKVTFNGWPIPELSSRNLNAPR